MLLRPSHGVAAAVLALLLSASAGAQAPVSYRLSFPDRVHHVAHVEITFPDVSGDPLELNMSRSSPGRYALHEFAKNVFDVQALDASERPLVVSRPNPHQWNVEGHDGTVRVRYRVFGDRIDGTYLAVDATHAHINVPATLMWATGLEDRPTRVTFVPPPGTRWRVATQLLPTDDPFVYTAPNQQYLMDSPIEFGEFVWRTFTMDARGDAPAQTIRLAVHHDGDEAEVDEYVRDLERIVLEQQEIFGELPTFDGGSYTFLADYLPWADGDGMEHRNSTVLSSRGSIRRARLGLLSTVAHEFFHVWNVERIRPRSLEPFDFRRANASGELWLAEGFTSYYAGLTLARAGVLSLEQILQQWSGFINTVALGPGRRFHSAVEMSRMAPFVDAAQWVDETNFSNTFISYYTYGAAIGLGLDLSLRRHSGGRVGLDDFMRQLWEGYGKPGGHPLGTVGRPYTLDDVRTVLGETAGSQAFATEFFDRFIDGRDIVDYAGLLGQAGFQLRPARPERGWIGDLDLDRAGVKGERVASPVPYGSPAHTAGLASGDEVVAIDGQPLDGSRFLSDVIGAKTPGGTTVLSIVRRGRPEEIRVTIESDPALLLVAVEASGGRLTDAQRVFRHAWLGSRVQGR